eukprot:2001361-Alexandrium_andersonii.AAC.1
MPLGATDIPDLPVIWSQRLLASPPAPLLTDEQLDRQDIGLPPVSPPPPAASGQPVAAGHGRTNPSARRNQARGKAKAAAKGTASSSTRGRGGRTNRRGRGSGATAVLQEQHNSP